MASFEERIYELGAEALGEQERQVAEVRGRGATLVAAGAVIASLLAKPVFHGGHTDGWAEVTSTGVGLLGSAGVLVFVVMLLRPYELGFSVKPGATYRALWDQEVLVQPMVDLALADAFEERRNANAALAVGMALPRRDKPPSPPAKPGKVPSPGSVPKLPQTIFNLEKRGSSGNSGGSRRSGRK